jgi:glycosyltransferase involved in cell wall biosynthesis
LSGAGGDPTVTVVITTKNAAHLLRDCLPRVRWADEIVVVDEFSTDETLAICASYPQCVVYQREDYIQANANYGFERAKSDWVMRLDSDEWVTPELAEEIPALMRTAPADVVGYSFWERPIVMGRELRHGWGRRHHRPMLFRRGRARYPLRTEHDTLEADGRWLPAEHGYLHFNYDSAREFVAKVHLYVERDVPRATLPERRPSRWRGPFEFARAFWFYYLKSQGFRDGRVGLVDATLRGYYRAVEWREVRRRFDRERGPSGG